MKVVFIGPMKFTIADPEIERFSARLSVDGSGCHIWRGSTDHLGYGRFRSAALHSSGLLVHRYAWLLTHGFLPVNRSVCHTCDVRACANPRHLFLGTHLENMQDMMRKGRGNKPRGSAHGNSRLDESAVREIRSRRASGEKGVALARAFGVTPALITWICKRRGWKHVA